MTAVAGVELGHQIGVPGGEPFGGVRDLATGSALDDATLAKFLDENGRLL
ncbi:hypothetical protein ACTMTF_06340 [Nonomuraea sp. ZG12]